MFGSNSIDRFALHPHSAVQQTSIVDRIDLVCTEKLIGFIKLTSQNIAMESKLVSPEAAQFQRVFYFGNSFSGCPSAF
jgi:hypothetical protein